ILKSAPLLQPTGEESRAKLHRDMQGCSMRTHTHTHTHKLTHTDTHTHTHPVVLHPLPLTHTFAHLTRTQASSMGRGAEVGDGRYAPCRIAAHATRKMP